MRHEIGTVIARRHYFHSLDSATPFAEVEIGAPTKSPEADGEYMCSYRLRSSAAERAETVYGIDELQALQLALGDVEAKLRGIEQSAGVRLRWLGGQEGDLGIRIPSFHG